MASNKIRLESLRESMQYNVRAQQAHHESAKLARAAGNIFHAQAQAKETIAQIEDDKIERLGIEISHQRNEIIKLESE